MTTVRASRPEWDTISLLATASFPMSVKSDAIANDVRGIRYG